MEEQKSTGKMKETCYLFNMFTDPSLEKLYQSFSIKQKRAGLECFLLTAVLFDIYMLVVPSGQDMWIFGSMTFFLAINSCILVWCKRDFESKLIWAAVPHLSWHLANAQVLIALFLKKNEVTSRDSLGWVLLLDYFIYVTLPIRLRYCIILSLGTCTSYIAALIGLSKSDLHFYPQHLSNCILLITANLMGLTSFLVEDKQQRRAFLETRQSLEVKLVIEEQSAEQLSANYNMTMRKFDLVQRGLRYITYIISKGRPASKDLISNNVKFMKKCKILAILLVYLVLLSHASFILFVNKENNLAFIIVRNVLLDKTIPKVIIFLVVVPHSVLFIFTPVCTCSYSVAQTSFALQALIEQIDILIEFENECNDVSKYRNSELYQEIIKKNLKYFSRQFNTIKKYNNFYNEYGKWILLVLYGISSFAMSTIFIFIISKKSQETIPFIGIFMILTIMFSITSEIGQFMQDLSEEVYSQLQNLKWYQYDKSNCNTFLVLLLQVKEPLRLNCYGLIIQNRGLLVKLYRVIHTYTTYYQSMR